MSNIRLLHRISMRKYNYTKASDKVRKQIDYLRDKGYVDFEIDDKESYIFHITPAGEDYLIEHHTTNSRWWITTIIAVLALLEAYREEMALIIKALMQ